jgi:cation transport regulator
LRLLDESRWLHRPSIAPASPKAPRNCKFPFYLSGTSVPYDTLEDLPENVTNVLPKHAQEIYRAAFNSAWDEYKDPDDRRGDASREETSHKVAWAAVKKEYEKEGDKWRKK